MLHRLSLVVAGGGFSLLQGSGFSLPSLAAVTGSRRVGQVAAALGLS